MANPDITLIDRIAYKFKILWEKLRGIDFLQGESVESLGLSPARSERYSSSANKYLDNVLSSLTIHPGDRIIDFGCGKGAAMARMSRFDFETVEGVELSPKLADIAKTNMRRLGLKHAVIHLRDATQFLDLDRFKFFYFYNPFPCMVMQDVMTNILASLKRFPREASIIYRNPKCHEQIIEGGLFMKTKDFPTEEDFPISVYRYLGHARQDLA